MKTPYQILGEEGVRALANAVYDVMDELDEARIIRAMHADNLANVKEKLTDYLLGWMGGPPAYKEKTGSVCLSEAHAPYAIGEAERDQWLRCFHVALERVNASDELKAMLTVPIFRVADAIRNNKSVSPCESSDRQTDKNIIFRG